MTGDAALPRRAFLAVVGAAVAAGCSDGSLAGGTPTPTIGGDALRDVVAGSLPTVPEPMPVGVERAHVADGAARARSLLDRVPEPLGPDEVPNEAVRRELVDRREHATVSLREAATAPSRFEALAHIARARRTAASVAGAWAASDGTVTTAETAARASPVRERLGAVRERRRYVGDDPVAGVLVHAAVEARLGEAAGRLAELDHPTNYPDGHALDVGEVASRVEAARAALDDATYLYDRLDARRDLRPSFEAAAATVAEALRPRRRTLTAGRSRELVDRDVDDDTAYLLRILHGGATAPFRESAAGGPPFLARRVLHLHDQLATLHALEAARARVEDGETFPVRTADDVEGYRSAALAAVRDALDAGPHPQLRRHELATVVDIVASVDEELEHVGGTVAAGALGEEVVRYVEARLLAEAVPAASRAVGDALAG